MVTVAVDKKYGSKEPFKVQIIYNFDISKDVDVVSLEGKKE